MMPIDEGEEVGYEKDGEWEKEPPGSNVRGVGFSMRGLVGEDPKDIDGECPKGQLNAQMQAGWSC